MRYFTGRKMITRSACLQKKEHEEPPVGCLQCQKKDVSRTVQISCFKTCTDEPESLQNMLIFITSLIDGEEEWSDWSDTYLLKIHNYYELNGGQSTGEPHHTTSASQNQHTKCPGNGDNESNHCLSEESESGPSNISSEQSSSTIRDRPSQHDDIPGNGRNETNACRSHTSEIELSSTLTKQSSANTTRQYKSR
ncbi:unnamed protein product [Mytilus coruscus]|uniref:Uncharacterized protein n=1 Tax=Mytilus coruscus TaxID=42192 RepID=A0A6J8C8K5_MYTCO|nr:unnamed protein product [Mytilus coruscus]